MQLEYANMQDTLQAHLWTGEEVRAELDCILSSAHFIKSRRLSRFLRTVVEYLLNGRAEELKEYTIGTEVYERHPSYDPSIDSIVRTEARRLRVKLREYYANRQASSIVIRLEPGSYVPVIHSRPAGVSTPALYGHYLPQLEGVDCVTVTVSSIRALSIDSEVRELASDLTDDLLHELSQQACLRILCPTDHAKSDISSVSPDQWEFWRKSRVQAVVCGSLRPGADGFALHLQVVSLSGAVLWSNRFLLQATLSGSKTISEELLCALVQTFAPAA